jgi:hypothetical protein
VKNEQTWDAMADLMPGALDLLKKRISKQDTNPDIWQIHEAVMDSSDEVMANLLISLFGKFFKAVDYKTGIIYMLYDHSTSLWKTANCDYLHAFQSVHFAPLRAEYKSQLDAAPARSLS